MKKLEDRPWWPELVELKDVMSLRELSERFGAAPAAISNALKRNGLKRRAAPPGPRNKRSDTSKRKAAKRLAEMGLEPLPTDAASQIEASGATSGTASTPAPRGGSRLSPHLHLVGKVIDREVAELAGVSVSAVTNYRRRHGIPAATRRPKGVDVAPATKAAAPASSGGLGSRGFRVTIGEEDYVVVASNIVEAARIANDSGRGAVRKLELLGHALAG